MWSQLYEPISNNTTFIIVTFFRESFFYVCNDFVSGSSLKFHGIIFRISCCKDLFLPLTYDKSDIPRKLIIFLDMN